MEQLTHCQLHLQFSKCIYSSGTCLFHSENLCNNGILYTCTKPYIFVLRLSCYDHSEKLFKMCFKLL